MRKTNRTLIAAIIAAALAIGSYAFLGGSLTPVAEARLRDHPKLEAAHDALKEAKEYLENAAHNFHGHRDAAVHAIDVAMHEIRVCADEADHRDSIGAKEFADYPKLRRAKDHVKDAREYLAQSKGPFNGRKQEAVKAMDEAIRHIDICLED